MVRERVSQDPADTQVFRPTMHVVFLFTPFIIVGRESALSCSLWSISVLKTHWLGSESQAAPSMKPSCRKTALNIDNTCWRVVQVNSIGSGRSREP